MPEIEMSSLMRRFMLEDKGATAIEYALIAGGISIVIVASVNALGTQLTATFTNVSNLLGSASR
jgi:pilus assembly protein Flp/PilA